MPPAFEGATPPNVNIPELGAAPPVVLLTPGAAAWLLDPPPNAKGEAAAVF